jgi:ADP-ribose pyrophosphatase YjhB (NUDIX family)
MEIEAPPPSSLDEALHELHARFLNLPRSEEPTVARIFFQIQQAHWFYEDEWADDGVLPHVRFEEFSRRVFELSPLLQEYCDRHADFKAAFKEYGRTIPKYGCALINAAMTHILLVCGLNSKVYSFPKGKVNQGEAGLDCAAREAWEETGYDPAHLLSESAAVQHADADGGFLKVYIAVGVPDDGSVVFTPQTKKEVGGIAWVEIASLEGQSGYAPVEGGGLKKIKTHRVSEFLGKVRGLLDRRRGQGGKKGKGKGGQQQQQQQQQAQQQQQQQAQAQKKKGGGGAAGPPPPAAGPPLDPEELLDAPLNAGGGTWSVKDMFKANANLLGVKFVYDGNPHTFGDEGMQATTTDGGADGGAAAADGQQQKKSKRKKKKAAAAAAQGGAAAGSAAAGGGGGAGATTDESGTDGEGGGDAAGAAAGRRAGGGASVLSVREPFRLDRPKIMKVVNAALAGR